MNTISFVPKVSKIQEDTVNILRDALTKAEAGDAVEAIVILKHADGGWSEKYSGSIEFLYAVGMLEAIKQQWISHYLTHMNPGRGPA